MIGPQFSLPPLLSAPPATSPLPFPSTASQFLFKKQAASYEYQQKVEYQVAERLSTSTRIMLGQGNLV